MGNPVLCSFGQCFRVLLDFPSLEWWQLPHFWMNSTKHLLRSVKKAPESAPRNALAPRWNNVPDHGNVVQKSALESAKLPRVKLSTWDTWFSPLKENDLPSGDQTWHEKRAFLFKNGKTTLRKFDKWEIPYKIEVAFAGKWWNRLIVHCQLGGWRILWDGSTVRNFGKSDRFDFTFTVIDQLLYSHDFG